MVPFSEFSGHKFFLHRVWPHSIISLLSGYLRIINSLAVGSGGRCSRAPSRKKLYNAFV
jgi:hypothetical protein